MRGVLAGLIVAFIIVVVALLIAAIGSLGVAAIGWVLSRWFDLTQWQGSLIALAVALGIGVALYRIAAFNSPLEAEPEWVDWSQDDDDDEEAAPEPPVVPWRRRRPTQGELPLEGSPHK